MTDSQKNRKLRNTDQFLLPLAKKPVSEGKYDIYPSFKIENNLIWSGFESLAEELLRHKIIIAECYSGVLTEIFPESLDAIFSEKGIDCKWIKTSDLFKAPEEIRSLKKPFLGGVDPLFGTRTNLELRDFFDQEKLRLTRPDKESDLNIIIGPGASLAGWGGLLVYLDIPKNEIQFRARAGRISNLGEDMPGDAKEMYKTFYFVDWVVLNKHKKSLLGKTDIFIDTQRPDLPVWTSGNTLRNTLRRMSRNAFRARPWFEPGTWGGSWIKNNIEGLNPDVPNYAWSFELITPENGLIIESESLLLEFSFDLLMYQEAEAVLGDCAGRFGSDFPIRFDFLDTFDGGSLSIQCHPRPEYIRAHFGENFTQEETYYILDCKEDSSVYLGFREDIDKDEFGKALNRSFRENEKLDVEKYILKHPSQKHDLFLIPYGTIHGSGKNNLVLEISSTPYIFTFKMYDWLRPDLDGKPRPLIIARGMENLFFDRKGAYVNNNLISKPVLVKSGADWKLYHLETHKTHFYDVMRYHFKNEITLNTGNKCFVMSLTEGTSVELVTGSSAGQRFSFAETFVIPAAAGEIRIINRSDCEAVLVYAFVK